MGASSLTQELRMSMYQSKIMKVVIGLTRKQHGQRKKK